MAYQLKSARYLAAECHRQAILPGDRVIDATMGNGHDTCALAALVGEHGKVIGLDVQEQAVEATKEALEQVGYLERCELYCLGHEHISHVVTTPVRAAVFNLGWLPGGSKEVTTRWETTKAALEACFSLLLPGGIITVCAYPGHEEGGRELQELKALFAGLAPQQFNVLHQVFLNAGPGAPECFILQSNKLEEVVHMGNLLFCSKSEKIENVKMKQIKLHFRQEIGEEWRIKEIGLDFEPYFITSARGLFGSMEGERA